MKRTVLILTIAFCLIFMSTAICAAFNGIKKCSEQTVIAGAAHNFLSNSDQFIYSTFVVRNVDPIHEITVVRVDFYNPDGSFVRGFIEPDDGVILGSGASRTWRTGRIALAGVDEYDGRGGRPFFRVEWVANDMRVIEPMIYSAIVLLEYLYDEDGNIIGAEFKSTAKGSVKIIDQKCNMGRSW